QSARHQQREPMGVETGTPARVVWSVDAGEIIRTEAEPRGAGTAGWRHVHRPRRASYALCRRLARSLSYPAGLLTLNSTRTLPSACVSTLMVTLSVGVVP